MLNNVIRLSFASIGAVTGFTLTNTLISVNMVTFSNSVKVALVFVFSILIGILFYATGSKIIEITMEALDKLELLLQDMTLYELVLSVAGLIAGLIIANLITIPINKVDVIGVPLSIIVNILFGSIGIAIALGKKNESIIDAFRNKKVSGSSVSVPKLLDTSVIIDGRIIDIFKTGILEGDIIVPVFVLEELRKIADSSDPLKRNRGRRGLDILNILQKDLGAPVRIDHIQVEDVGEVDDKLLKAAQKLNAQIVTIDYNLNKVAAVHGVQVFNINELANAVKPIALPGEEMTVQVIRDGKENGQGVAFMDDGTMIVVEGGRKHIGESINVSVTSVLQTAAGRMIFAKPKQSAERIIY